LQAPAGNVIYGRTDLLRDHRDAEAGDPPRTGAERELFPGFAIVLLAACGLWSARRADARPLIAAMTLMLIAGFVLSLGPDGARSIYAALHRYVFGFQAIRAPARFAVLVFFALSTLAALGWRELHAQLMSNRSRARRMAPAIVIAIVALELLHVPTSLDAAPPLQTDVGQWLHRAPEPGAVAVLPLTIDVDNTHAMVQSLEHRRPLLNGYSGQRPAFYPPLVDALSAFPADDALLALLESDVRFVVVPRPVAAGELASPLVERARFGGGTIYELRWTPEIETRVRQHAAVEPTPPGPVPFREGETASYTVTWNGAGNITAGTIVTRVDGPPYRLVVTADTAPWMARFYEVHAVLTTIAGADLMPARREQRLVEGSRTVNRVYEFDSARAAVRIGQSVEDARSPQAVVLPLSAHARDAIAALFYARTLPLTPGSRYRLPVNESGRNSIVEFSVGDPGTILVQGRPQRAIRIDPRIEHRVERRTPPTAVVWLAAEAPHVPIAIDVDAAFGRIRVELTQYRP
jgi:hypothetical protein